MDMIYSPFQIMDGLTFLTQSLTSRLIQKICVINIVKFTLFVENLY